MEKINLLKKILPISAAVIVLLYLIRTFLILPVFIPFSRELDLVNCCGVGFWISCNYNFKGWIVLSVITVVFVSAIVYYFHSRKNQKF